VLPFKEIAKIFEQRNPGVDLDTRFDKPARIAKDIVERGHRPDIFISPGPVEMSIVEAAGLIDLSTKKPFATYRLGLIVAGDNPAGLRTVEDLAQPQVKAVVLADPQYNSVGAYAKEILQNRGVWEKVEQKTIFSEDATAGLRFILDGTAQASITSMTCPFVTAPEAVPKGPLKFVESIPPEQYGQIECLIACLTSTRDRDMACKFVDFVTSQEIQGKLEELGMSVLKGPERE